MKGDKSIINKLNELLTCELSAIDLYFVAGRTYKDLGYEKIFAHFDGESNHERLHAEMVVDRIIFLEGIPQVNKRLPFEVSGDIEKDYKFALEYELDNLKVLKELISDCFKVGDHVTREIAEKLIRDTEEDHIYLLEQKLSLIKDLGVKKYLQEQILA